MKCTMDNCMAFYVDETTKECKMGSVDFDSEGTAEEDYDINAYRRVIDGQPLPPKPDCEIWEHRHISAHNNVREPDEHCQLSNCIISNCNENTVNKICDHTIQENAKSCQSHCHSIGAPYFMYITAGSFATKCYCKSAKDPYTISGPYSGVTYRISGETC